MYPNDDARQLNNTNYSSSSDVLLDINTHDNDYSKHMKRKVAKCLPDVKEDAYLQSLKEEIESLETSLRIALSRDKIDVPHADQC